MNQSEFKSASNVPLRKLVKFIRKLRIEPKSILVIQEGIIPPESLNQLGGILKQNGIHDVVLLVVKDIHGIENLDEATMNKHGWYHLPQILNTMKITEARAEHD